jgi:hypothetical protein
MVEERPPSRATGPYGRGTSFGRDTSGYKGWMPVQFKAGTRSGGIQEGFKNVLTNEEFIPKNGWNGEPPCPTGELATTRHSGDAYREGWERIFGQGSQKPLKE